MKESILKKVRDYITETGMIRSGDKVLVALSGGADSVAMTHILLLLSGEMGFEVCAAHLNHCLRGEESDYDEAFVRSFCAERGIELKVESADIALLAEKNKQGTEECARNVRYDFLFRTAQEIGADKIATAHTLSDNAETVIFNLVRGSGLNGLTGIPETRGRLIRPLLKLTREETELYTKEAFLPFVTDSSNDDTVYTRNYIRKEIIPRLVEINPAFFRSLERLTDSVKEDNAFLEAEAEKCLSGAAVGSGEYRVKVITSAGLPIMKRALLKVYTSFTGQKLSSQQLNSFCDFVSYDRDGRFQLPGAFAVKYAGHLKMEASAERVLPKRFYLPANSENILPDGRRVTLKRAPFGSFGKSFIDADRVCGSLNLRLKASLDTLKLPKRPTKSLKKLFSESKIPISDRDRAVVLCDDEGVVWVEKLGVAERCAVTNNTLNILEISVKG